VAEDRPCDCIQDHYGSDCSGSLIDKDQNFDQLCGSLKEGGDGDLNFCREFAVSCLWAAMGELGIGTKTYNVNLGTCVDGCQDAKTLAQVLDDLRWLSRLNATVESVSAALDVLVFSVLLLLVSHRRYNTKAWAPLAPPAVRAHTHSLSSR